MLFLGLQDVPISLRLGSTFSAAGQLGLLLIVSVVTELGGMCSCSAKQRHVLGGETGRCEAASSSLSPKKWRNH